MSNKKIAVILSSAGELALQALFFRGALTSPELPSKEGVKELHELGLVETGTVERSYHGNECFTWLTPEGQRAAIERTTENHVCEGYNLKLGICRGGLRQFNGCAEAIESIITQIQATNNAFDELAQTVAVRFAGEHATENPASEGYNLRLNGSCSFNGAGFVGDIKSVRQLIQATDGAGISTLSPEDTLHQALVAALPSTPSDKVKERAEAIAEAVGAAYAKLKEPALVSVVSHGVFTGSIFVSPPTIDDKLGEEVRKITLAVIKRESEPGGLLFKK